MKSVFSYYLTENEIAIKELTIRKQFGKFNILIDEGTPFSHFAHGEVECVVLGCAVNVISGQTEEIANDIAKNCEGIEEVVDYENNLGGKYVIFYKIDDDYYLLGDATCSIPIYYTVNNFDCSSNYQYIVNNKGYAVDEEYFNIRKSGNISQAMPYDITQYREIKQVIPNHYLEINSNRAVRFINSVKKQKGITVERATEIVSPMIEKILNMYLDKFKTYCPITAGRDSRVVLAFLQKSGKDFSCYTIKHPEHNDKTQDIVIPAELCSKIGVEHNLIEDIDVPKQLKEEFDRILGENSYSLRTLRIAHTIKENFGDGAIINGDIIGQVGKCSLHRDIPSIFATPFYFRCKLHNYSKGAKIQLKNWIKEIKSSREKVNLFDLFSIENRLGRWAGQENLIYNTLGQEYLNIFNCRKIVYTWTAVARKKRKLSKVHVDLISEACGSLKEIPFEKDESLVFKISKTSGIAYLLSSYAKFFIEKRKYKKGAKL